MTFKKSQQIPQLIIRRLVEKLILLHQEVMILKGLLYTVMTVIVHSVAIKLQEVLDIYTRRLMKR